MAAPTPTKFDVSTITSISPSQITKLPPSLISELPSSVTATICLPLPTEASKNDLPGTNISLHHLFIDVGCLCMALACVFCLLNFCSHLVWRSNLKQQKHLMRINLLPAIYCIFAWCSVDFYGLGTYLDPIPKVYELYCVVSFFQFMVEVLTPNEELRNDFFISATRMNRRATKQQHDRGSLRWYHMLRLAEYMSLSTIFIITILEEIMYSVTCATGEPRAIFGIAIEVLSFMFTITALMGLIRLYMRFRKDFQGTKVLRKFWTFKGFVWLIIHQQVILEIIQYTNVVKPTEYMSNADFKYGIPEFMLCCEAFIFSIAYITTLSGLSYRTLNKAEYSQVASSAPRGPDASVAQYLFAVLVPMDVFTSYWHALHLLFNLPRGRKAFDYTGGTGVGWRERQESEDHPLKSEGTSDSDHPPPPFSTQMNSTPAVPYDRPGNYNTSYNGGGMA